MSLQRTSTQQTILQHVDYLYIPALVFVSVFIFYPFLRGIMISFTNWNGYSPRYHLIGLRNYLTMFTDRHVIGAITNTLIYGIGSTFFQTLFGLALAVFLDQELKGKGLVRTIVYLPVIISPLIIGYIWYFFFRYSGGAMNDLMIFLGKEPVDWFGNGRRAVWIITGINSYQFVGVSMIIFLAGLQSIQKHYYEAAVIDGASAVQRFFHVTIPLLMPAFTTSVIFNIIGGMKLFDVIVATTDGGPGYASQSLSTMMYALYFSAQNAGYAAALGNLMLALVLAITLILLTFFKSREVELS